MVDRYPFDLDLAELVFSEGRLWATRPGGLVGIDPMSGQVQVDVDFGDETFFLAAGGGSLWVTDFGSDVVYQVDADAGEVVDSLPVKTHSEGVTFADGHVWASNHRDSSVQRIDPATGTVVAEIAVGDGQPRRAGPSSSAAGFGSVWVGVPYLQAVARIDIATNTVTAEVQVEDCVACGRIDTTGHDTPDPDDDGVWVLGNRGVTRIDPATNTVAGSIDLGFPADHSWDGGIAVGQGKLWVSTARATVLAIDPATGQEGAEIPVGGPRSGVSTAGSLAYGNGSLWAWDAARRTLVRIDPSVTQH